MQHTLPSFSSQAATVGTLQPHLARMDAQHPFADMQFPLLLQQLPTRVGVLGTSVETVDVLRVRNMPYVAVVRSLLYVAVDRRNYSSGKPQGHHV